VLGNYSRFLRPGSQRIGVTSDTTDLRMSAYLLADDKSAVTIVMNPTNQISTLSLESSGKPIAADGEAYVTSDDESLGRHVVQINSISIPAKSVVTIVTRMSGPTP
jgi:hypothetical protein